MNDFERRRFTINGARVRLTLPMDLARAITEAGYTHYSVEVRQEGILIIPSKSAFTQPLPEWGA